MAATFVLSACGGSPVIESAAPATNAGVDAGDGLGAVADAAEVPGAASARADGVTTDRGADGNAGAGQAVPGTTAAGVKQSKGTAAGSVGTKQPAAGAAAVEKLVASHPIFGGTAACRPATLSDVPIGNVSTLSGVLGELFAPARSALETFVAAQNACGGLNGHRIKLYVEDDQGDPSVAFAKGLDLVQSKKILAFVGNIQNLTIDGFLPAVKKTGVPVLGGDVVSNTWYTNPLLFPQGSGVQSMAYAMLAGGTKEYHKKTTVGVLWCIEVPRACEQFQRATGELAPDLGLNVAKSIQVSITAPSYVQQCLELKSANAETVFMAIDAASMQRVARSCEQVGYFPKVVAFPIAVGNQKQFFGNKWLGNTYVPMNVFPWMSSNNAAERYWQSSVKKYSPGIDVGGASSLAWVSGALLVAAAANLPAENPTTQDLLDTLFTFKGQSFTELGGLSGPKTFTEGASPADSLLLLQCRLQPRERRLDERDVQGCLHQGGSAERPTRTGLTPEG